MTKVFFDTVWHNLPSDQSMSQAQQKTSADFICSISMVQLKDKQVMALDCPYSSPIHHCISPPGLPKPCKPVCLVTPQTQ